MGPSQSRAHRHAAHPEISEREVLTLCDDGDLLLLREHVIHTTLRVAIDQRVAEDITAFQDGAFPTTRFTRLPAWTSCALLLRLEGVLHLLHVDAYGMRLVAFHDHVVQRAGRRDMYAIRRLQHVRNDQRSSFLRQFTFQLSQMLPVDWCHDATTTTQLSEATIRIHPSVHVAVERMLQLCEPRLQLPAVPVSPVDRSVQLATAMVIAVYEQLGLLEPLERLSPRLLTPSSLMPTSGHLSPPTERLLFTPANALGMAMRLTP